MKKLIIFLSLFICLASQAQVVPPLTKTQNLEVSSGLSLAGRVIRKISIDTTLAENSNISLPTEKAVKRYVDRTLATRSVDINNGSSYSELKVTRSGYSWKSFVTASSGVTGLTRNSDNAERYLKYGFSADLKYYDGTSERNVYHDGNLTFGPGALVRNNSLIVGAGDYANILQYGAATSNTASQNNAAINTAISTGKTVVIPEGIFNVSTTFTLANGQSLIGLSWNSILQQQSDAPTLILGSFCTVKDVAFYGNATLSGAWPNYASNKPLQVGVYITNKIANNIQNCYFEGFGKSGIRVSSVTSLTYRGNQINACYGQLNHIGILCDTLGEYTSINNCNFTLNNIGIQISGGNNNINGGQFNDNKTGIYLTGGTNNSHCGATGTKFNHNTEFSLWCNGVTLGYRFTSCDFYYGGMYLQASADIRLYNCDIDVNTDAIYIRGGNNRFVNCTFPGAALDYRPNFNSVASETFFDNCIFKQVAQPTASAYTHVSNFMDIVDLPNANSGVVLVSANGTRYKITVNNAGTIVVTAL